MNKHTNKGGPRRRKKITILLMMMMRATATSAATASDATTTSGLGSGLGSGSQSKTAVATSNSFFVVVHLPNFIQIGQKTKRLKIFAVSRLWLVGPVSKRIAVFISNSFYVVFNFQTESNQNQLKVYTIGQLW